MLSVIAVSLHSTTVQTRLISRLGAATLVVNSAKPQPAQVKTQIMAAVASTITLLSTIITRGRRLRTSRRRITDIMRSKPAPSAAKSTRSRLASWPLWLACRSLTSRRPRRPHKEKLGNQQVSKLAPVVQTAVWPCLAKTTSKTTTYNSCSKSNSCGNSRCNRCKRPQLQGRWLLAASITPTMFKTISIKTLTNTISWWLNWSSSSSSNSSKRANQSSLWEALAPQAITITSYKVHRIMWTSYMIRVVITIVLGRSQTPPLRQCTRGATSTPQAAAVGKNRGS